MIKLLKTLRLFVFNTFRKRNRLRSFIQYQKLSFRKQIHHQILNPHLIISYLCYKQTQKC